MDTIVAQVTPMGFSGVGIIRLSGPRVPQLTQQLLRHNPTPRHAHYGPFYDDEGRVLDVGIALYFPAPHSFTGEHVLELQGHGGPAVLSSVLKTIVNHGARQAEPGEFSKRAFLNGKMDLVQAEAVADLIHAVSERAAMASASAMQGSFSKKIQEIVQALTSLRAYVEAALDFPDEDIAFITQAKVTQQLNALLLQLQSLQKNVKQGVTLQEGISVVLSGLPNAGKSSLLNQLSGEETAIVTSIAGTTRDVLKQRILISGIPIHLVDTAGLRQGGDEVERQGIQRAHREVKQAQGVLFIVDDTQFHDPTWQKTLNALTLPKEAWVCVIRNKVDLTRSHEKASSESGYDQIFVSAKTGFGLEALRGYLQERLGVNSEEGHFTARQRHVNAMVQAEACVRRGIAQLLQHQSPELLAEDLHAAQRALGEITGQVRSDDLLGKIFSEFCIGK